MEISNSYNNNRESKSKAKPPTRLQKQAPAALRLHRIAIGDEIGNPNDHSSNEIIKPSCAAIPLLSPLILSPLPSQERQEARSRGNNVDNSGNVEMITPPQSFDGWKHPAVETFPDASSLFGFFQAQCVLVNRVQ